MLCMHSWLNAIGHQYVAQCCASGINMAVQHALKWVNAVHHASKWLSTVDHRTVHRGSVHQAPIRHQYSIAHCCASGIYVGSGVEFGPPLFLASNQSASINNHTIYSVSDFQGSRSSKKRWGDLDCTRWPF